jgi:ribonuclease HI
MTAALTSVEIYCDGACRGNPGPGGWGALLQSGASVRELSGAERATTNNRMELTAALEALRALRRRVHVHLYTDSKYVCVGITEWLPAWRARDWKTADRKPVRNRDLWQLLEAQADQHRVEWHWVKGHSGVPGNERADALANSAIDAMLALDCG